VAARDVDQVLNPIGMSFQHGCPTLGNPRMPSP
jgi:hypothetical protein